MNAHVRAALLGFGLAFVLGHGATACSSSSSSSGECNCPKTPAQPTAQAPLPITYAWSSEAQEQSVTVPVDPAGGTLEVKGDSVVIQYRTEAGDYEVVYGVTGPVTY